MMYTRKLYLFGGALLALGVSLTATGCCQTKANSNPTPTVMEAKAQKGEEPCSIVLAVTGMS